jgi:hypothetical protein
VQARYRLASIDSWEYEGFTDVAHRYKLICLHGFCHLHIWQSARRSNGVSFGLIYNEILTDVEQELENYYRRWVATDNAVMKPESVLIRWQRRWIHHGDEAHKEERT